MLISLLDRREIEGFNESGATKTARPSIIPEIADPAVLPINTGVKIGSNLAIA